MLKWKVSGRNMDYILDVSCERRKKRRQASKYNNKHPFTPVETDHGASEGARERGSPFEGTGSSLALFDEGSMSTNSSFACSDIAAEVPIAKMKIFTQNIYIKSFK